MRPSCVHQIAVGILAVANVISAQSPVQPATATAAPQPAAVEPYVIEGGGVSMQPWYWLTSSRPLLRAGAQSTATQTAALDFPGKANAAAGITFSVPAGKQNSLRISYFRATGSGDTIAASDLALFSVGYTAGDSLTTNYKLQNVKMSWDYLSYTFGNKMRFKTFWEAQVTSISTQVDAPLKAVTVDASGVVTTNTAVGNKWLAYPTFGGGLEHAPSPYFRWEAKGSGFGVPRYGAIWDIEASGVLRVGRMELLAGHRTFSIKTSPRDDAYFKQTLNGPYVGIRWYWDMAQ